MDRFMYYEKLAVLNRENHKDLKLAPVMGFGFSRQSQTVALTCIEFVEAAKEYPIVFVRKESQELTPVALLSLKAGDNAFLAEDGSWKGHYVPAFVRSYPFILAKNGSEAPLVCIDETFAGFNGESAQPLFDAQGEPTPVLTHALNFLSDFDRQVIFTAEFMQKLEALGILVEQSANVNLPDAGEYRLNGFYVVDEQKLLALDAETATALFKPGHLALIYAHLMSLSNLQRLIK